MRRIFFDATGIVSFTTGLGKYSYYLLKALLLKSRLHFTILHQSDLKKSHPLFSLCSSRLEFLSTQIPVIGPRREISILKLRKYIQQHDLYHCTSSYLPAFGITIPSVVTIHDLKYLLYPTFFKNRLKVLYYKWIIRRGARKAKRIIAVSESTKKDLVNLGIPRNKITVIHESATILIGSVKTNIKLPAAVGDMPFLFFVGDNRPHKNISRIIKAYCRLMSELGEKCPNFVFAGAHFDNLRIKYANTKMSGKFIFLSTISEETLVGLYKRTIALVYPSLYEGFGLPILEAMSVGTPVITSDCSSIPEVAGNAAILVDPCDVNQLADAMIKVVQHKPEREALKRLGIRQAKKFSWEKAALMTLKTYEDVLFEGSNTYPA